MALVLNILPIHAKIVASIHAPKNPKMATKPDLNILSDPNQLLLGSRWHWCLRILHIYAKARLELQNPKQEYLLGKHFLGHEIVYFIVLK